MNIFALDYSPAIAARFHCDAHVVKMVLETAQILSTVLAEQRIPREEFGGYKPTHRHHPSVLWAGATRGNFLWLCDLGDALADEYRFRYGRTHASASVIERARLYAPTLPSGGLTPFALAMDDDLRSFGDPVTAYRAYYIRKSWTMARFAYTKREVPPFVQKAHALVEQAALAE